MHHPRPARRNPLLEEIHDPELREEHLSKRRLGTTELAVDLGQVGTSNATKPENLGPFDYAHIRVPLPKDLKGSGIFHASRGHGTPVAYFLMAFDKEKRRSRDGYVSASGMFKMTYPWASEEEEKAEKIYLQSLPGVDKEEIAGNVWVPVETALDLADEYGVRDWLLLLLDPAPILSGMPNADHEIVPPPPFHIPKKSKKASRRSKSQSPAPQVRATRAKTPTLNGTIIAPPEESPKAQSPRKRTLRSMSPTKIPVLDQPAKTPRKIATPKRLAGRRGRPAASASVEPDDVPTKQGTRKASARQNAAHQATVESIEDDVKFGNTSSADDTSSSFKVETPTRYPDDAQGYLASARKALDDAEKLKSSRYETVRSRKRKVSEMTADDDNNDDDVDHHNRPVAGSSQVPAEADGARSAKRVKVAPLEERKQRIQKRATVGIGVGLAVGALIPVISSFLQNL